MRKLPLFHKRVSAAAAVTAVLTCGASGCALQEALIDGLYIGLSDMTAVLLGDALGTERVAQLDLFPDLIPGILAVGETAPQDR